jgi:tRNA-Thr(GGU) m(6)t(6)A37 methyltransferase TsaA
VTAELEDHGGHPSYEMWAIGWVQSPLVDRATAPKQGYEGAPEAWLAFAQTLAEGLRDLRPGSEILVLTWLHRADRDTLSARPRGNQASRERGVFSTRSPDRPNPIGLHRVKILSIVGTRIRVRDLEAIQGTPIIDVKPVLDGTAER